MTELFFSPRRRGTAPSSRHPGRRQPSFKTTIDRYENAIVPLCFTLCSRSWFEPARSSRHLLTGRCRSPFTWSESSRWSPSQSAGSWDLRSHAHHKTASPFRTTTHENAVTAKLFPALAHYVRENDILISTVFAAARSWFVSSISFQFPRSRIAGPMTTIAPYTSCSPSTGAPIAVTPRWYSS